MPRPRASIAVPPPCTPSLRALQVCSLNQALAGDRESMAKSNADAQAEVARLTSELEAMRRELDREREAHEGSKKVGKRQR